jgi:AbrB family looped-hinge helix DNA binding protein
MLGERPWTRLVSQSCHGRVTIPIEFRRTLGIREGETLEMTLEQGELRLRRLAMPDDDVAVADAARDAGADRGDGRAE